MKISKSIEAPKIWRSINYKIFFSPNLAWNIVFWINELKDSDKLVFLLMNFNEIDYEIKY